MKNLIALVVLLFATPALAGLSILKQDVRQDGQFSVFTFELSKPLSNEVDEAGRRAVTFQYHIQDEDFGPVFYENLRYSSVIRGVEENGLVIPVRSAEAGNIDDDPAAGGWGEVLGYLVMERSGNKYTFAAPTDLLSNNEKYTYGLEVYEYGAKTDQASGVFPAAVPLPPAVLSVIPAAILAFLFRKWKRA